MALQFLLLGGFEVRLAGRPLPIGGVKPRQLLATLLLQPDRPVSMDRLIEVLWPVDPPRSAAANVQTYVSALRGALAADHVVRRPPGYACQLGTASLDTASFIEQADEATRLHRLGRTVEALAASRNALALWRGQPLADLPSSPLWRVDLDRLAERRLLAVEEGLELRLCLTGADDAGGLPGIVAELRGLLAEHPLRERMWLLLLRALAALDRRADAVAAYAECRRVLADELGVEPGPELRKLHLNLLAEPSPGSVVSSPVSVAPRLDAAAQALLRGLAAFGDEPVPEWVAGALLDTADPGPAVDGLIAARLVAEAGTDRLGQRRLRVPLIVRLVAQETAPDPAALARVLGGYLHLAEQAAAALPASQFGPGVTVAPRWTGMAVPAAVHADPSGWYAAEHAALLAAIDVADRADRADLAWELAFALVPWCALALRPDVWRRSHHAAQEACRRLGDPLGSAVTLRGLGQLHLYHDEFQQAEAAFGRARLIFAQLGHPAGVAAALAGLGTVHRLRGESDRAIDYYTRALRSYVDAGLRWGEAYALGAIGQVWLGRGDTDQACAYLSRALDIATAIGDRHREAHLTHQLGIVSARQGRIGEAETRFTAALNGFVAIADLHGEAYALVELAALVGGDERLIRALDIYQRLGDRSAEAETVSRLSELYSASGRGDLADAYRDEARRLTNLLR